MRLDGGAFLAYYAAWIPALAVFVGARWLTGRLVGAKPALWPRGGTLRARIAVAVGGSLGCALATIGLVLVVNLAAGTRVMDLRPTVDGVPEGLPAHRAGILPGDAVVAVDQARVYSVEEIVAKIRVSTGPVTVAVERGGRPLSFTMTPVDHRVGMQLEPAGVTLSHSPAMALSSALGAPFSMVLRLGQALAPRRSGFGGPVGIVKAQRPGSHRLSDGLAWQLMLTAMLGQLIALVLLGIPRRAPRV